MPDRVALPGAAGPTAEISATGPLPPAGEAAVLRLEGVTKSWSGVTAPVLDCIDLELSPASTTSIVGRNGAGKTTLLRIIAGLITADAGAIRLQGKDPERDRLEYQRRVGLVAAGHSGLYARLSVEDHLWFWARLALLPRGQRAHAVAHSLGDFELEPLRQRRVDRLSMGQRQRLRLALAFLHQPVVVALDEPHTSLDAEGLAVLDSALGELKRRGGSALICWPAEAGAGVVALDRRLRLTDGALAAG